MKAPALKGTALSADAIAEVVTWGKDGAKARHRKRVAGLSADQAMVIANFVKGLKETRTYSKWRVPCGFPPRY